MPVPRRPLHARRAAIACTAVALAAALGAAGDARLDAQLRDGAAAGPQGMGIGPAGQVRDDAAQPVGTGRLSGTVTTDGTGTPVRRARVTLSGQEIRGARTALTDDFGRFAFHGLPAGRFTMTASKAGYVDIAYGAKRAGRPGTPIQLLDGQAIERLSIALPRGGVITGIVVDENGEPAPGTQVRAYRYVMRTGERSLQPAGMDQTDDRGMYRIFQLQPGEYVVSAVPRNTGTGDFRQALMAEVESAMQQLQAQGGPGRGAFAGRGAPPLLERINQLQEQIAAAGEQQARSYTPVYYPGTPSAAMASSVTLAVGQERAGVDFQLQLVPTARVDGVVVSPDGVLPPNTQLALLPAGQPGGARLAGLGRNVARAGADGRFSFGNVTPGEYTLQTRSVVRALPTDATPAPGRGGRGGRGGGPIVQVLWASMDVSVNGQDLTGIVLDLQPGMTVSGRIAFEGAASPPSDLSRVARVSLVPRGQQELEMVPPVGEVDDTGRFTITGVAPGRYAISAGIGGAGRGRGAAGPAAAGGAWIPKSALVGGQDALDVPLDIGPNENVSNALITFTDRTQELSGTIQDVTGRPTADVTIIVFPSDRRYWLPQARRIASSRPGTDGRFVFRGLPPGEYRLTAVTDVEPGEWYDPAFLTQLLQVSIPVSLAEGAATVQDIKVAASGS